MVWMDLLCLFLFHRNADGLTQLSREQQGFADGCTTEMSVHLLTVATENQLEVTLKGMSTNVQAKKQRTSELGSQREGRVR